MLINVCDLVAHWRCCPFIRTHLFG